MKTNLVLFAGLFNNLGMRHAPSINPHFFGAIFTELLSVSFITQLFQELGPGQRRSCKLSPHPFIMAMVFHVLSGGGTLAQHVNQLTGIDISDSALSQRRGNL